MAGSYPKGSMLYSRVRLSALLTNRLERLARSKHTSLLRSFANCRQKNCSIRPWSVLNGRNATEHNDNQNNETQYYGINYDTHHTDAQHCELTCVIKMSKLSLFGDNHNSLQKDTQQNDTEYNGLLYNTLHKRHSTLLQCWAGCLVFCYTECLYTECLNAQTLITT